MPLPASVAAAFLPHGSRMSNEAAAAGSLVPESRELRESSPLSILESHYNRRRQQISESMSARPS